jgi:hypothetical protein
MQMSLLQKDYLLKEIFTIVIPAYNEEGTIRDVVKKISIIIVSLALLAGCGAALVRNVDAAKITGNHAVAYVEKAIVREGADLGLMITKKSDKRDLCRNRDD